ncbi:Pentatricopeptide repeat-containing protein, partial [Mucuna pruriens]
MCAMLNVVRRKGFRIINVSLTRPSSFSTSTSDANAIIHVLTSSNNFAQATFLAKQCLQNSPTLCSSLLQPLNRANLTSRAYAILLLAFCQLGFVHEALCLYKTLSFLPPLQPCNALLHGLVKTQRFHSLWEVYRDMVSRGFSPTVITYGILMQCCCSQGDSNNACRMFDEMLERGIVPNVVVYTILIRVFCNEGQMEEAECVFRRMRESAVVTPNLYTYKTLMDGYCKMSDVKRVFDLYSDMLKRCLQPDVVTFATLIDVLCKVGDFKAARNCFAYMAKFDVVPNAHAYNSLIDGYCKVGNLPEAMGLWEEMERCGIFHDVFTYNILIKGLCDSGRLEEAEGLMEKMDNVGVLANSVTYNVVIDRCCKTGDMEKAIEVCSQMTERKIEPNVITFSTLIDGFCKKGNVKAAMGLYTEMVIKGLAPDVVTYTALIDGHCKVGNTKEAFRLHKEMLDAGLKPNVFTVSCVIDGLLKDGRTYDAIKLFLEKTGAGCPGGKMDSRFCSPNSVMYAILIQGLCKDGRVFKAAKFFAEMRWNGFKPDMLVYVTMLQAHFQFKHMVDVMMLHADMLKMGVMQNTSIYRVLSRGYGANGYLKSAHMCSEQLMEYGIQFPQSGGANSPMSTWHNKSEFPISLKPPKPKETLRKHLECNRYTKVLLLFRSLLRKRPTPNHIDSFSLLYALKACNHKHSSTQGKQLHALIIKLGYHAIAQVQTCLLKTYAQRGNLRDAHQVFDEIPSKNIVCWTSLISAYVDNHKPGRALQLFRLMRMNNVEPDQVAVTVALSACAETGELEMGEWIHALVRHKQEMNRDLCLDNAFINMYAKCGDVVAARKVFDGMRSKDVTTWTSMIVGHAVHGQVREALQLFSQMNSRRDQDDCVVTPNDVTFIGVLMACSHAGLVEEGKWHFRSMSEVYGIQPREAHFGCMVDLLCRGGHLRDAYDFIMEMPVPPNAVVWRTLLGACSVHGELELAAEVRHILLKLDPGYVGDSVAMSNIYANKGMWNKKIVVRNQIKQSRAPGCSSIEVGSGVGEFVTSDDDHPLMTDK